MQLKFWRGSGKKTLAHFLLPLRLLRAPTPSLCDAEVYSDPPRAGSFNSLLQMQISLCQWKYIFPEAKISLQRLHLHADTLPKVYGIYRMAALENYSRMLVLSVAERMILFQRSRLPSEQEFQKFHQLLGQAEGALPN